MYVKSCHYLLTVVKIINILEWGKYYIGSSDKICDFTPKDI